MAKIVEKGRGVFAKDETDSLWQRKENIEILVQICPEGYANAKKYKHFIIGNGPQSDYLGIPGRFMLEEQPAGGKTGFTLWQPLNGGEEHFDTLETMEEDVAHKIFGYWIAKIDGETLTISEA